MFSSLLIEQLTDLEKVRIQNLKFKTDLPDRVMDGWSLNHIHAIVNITFTLSNSNQAALTLGSSSSSNHTAASKQCSTYEIALNATAPERRGAKEAEGPTRSCEGEGGDLRKLLCRRLSQETIRKCPVFDLASQTSPSGAGALPQELGH